VLLKGYLGDAVMATPLLHALAKQDGLQVTVLTEPAVADLLQPTFPSITFRASRSKKNVFRQAREMRSCKFDTALVVNRSFRAAIVAALARVPKRIGHAYEGRQVLLTQQLRYDEDQFEAESYLDLAREAGFALQSVQPYLTPQPDLIDATKAKIADATVAIQPGARHIDKQIPISVMAEVVRHIQKTHKVAMLGGSEERPQGQELAALLDEKPTDLIGQFSLQETVAAVSQFDLVIGSDTGLMHIVAATGTATITAFGPTRPTKWAHNYAPHQAVPAPGKKMAALHAEQLLEVVERVLGRK
jgi:heptosyltransferase-2